MPQDADRGGGGRRRASEAPGGAAAPAATTVEQAHAAAGAELAGRDDTTARQDAEIARRGGEVAELRRRLAVAREGEARARGARGGGADPLQDGAQAGAARRAWPDRVVDGAEEESVPTAADGARLRAVADAVPHLVWTSGPGGRWTWANRRWVDYTGQSAPDARGHGWLDAVHPDDRNATLAAWRAADAGGELRVEHRLRGADGRHRWFATRASPGLEPGAAGEDASWCGTSTDVEDARRTEAALRESEARFRSFAEASPAVLWIVGEGDVLEYLSPAFERVWGEPREAVVRDFGRWADRLHPDDRAAVLGGLREVFQGERVVAEYRIRRASDGAVRWVRGVGFPIRDATGRVLRAAGFAQDITDQREADRLQRLLLDELNHRVKNALAGVQALAAQTARGRGEGQTSEAAFRAFEKRLFALSRAHDLLTREAWRGASLADVVRGTLAANDNGGAGSARILADGPEVRLTPNAAVALHMAFHELAANAAKHGALSAPDGRVEVAWSVAHGAAPDGGAVLEIRWRERGGPPVSGPPARRGFGSRMVESGLSRQLGGEARLEFLPDGVAFSLRLPLSDRVAAAAAD